LGFGGGGRGEAEGEVFGRESVGFGGGEGAEGAFGGGLVDLFA
jgi:hypothetical protein